MKSIKTEDAVGHILCHDVTRIVRGETKDAAFRKGHIITKEDIPLLLSMGKEHIFVWENEEGMMHENDAAEILCEICRGENIGRSAVKEGKIELSALADGLLKIDNDKLKKLNSIGQIVIATRHGNFPVKRGDTLAGVRVIPLIIDEIKMKKAKELCENHPILNVMPFTRKKTGLINTGSEILYGRVKDTFTPVIKEKLAKYGIDIAERIVLGDEHQAITKACKEMIDGGVDFIICTGGMSVDPDDETPFAIKNTGAKVVSYGAPVLPGSMFMLAYYSVERGMIPIVGLPGCVMYSEITIFDLVLPRILANDIISAEDLSFLGQGGLCLSCPECVFPNCGFGKGTA